jgi:hypothetical protein
MTALQRDACLLILLGVPITLVVLANFNKPGHAFIPGRAAMPVSYWGLVCFSGGAALLGLFILGVTF